MNLMFLCLVQVLIFTLVSVAFITLFERKLLGYMQMRVGPNKVGMSGIFQPFSDAIKLYSKEINWPMKSNLMPFIISPCLSLTLALMIWIVLPYVKPISNLKFSMLMFLSILGLGVYPIIASGWSSNSSYSLLGGMRSIAQTISYEVSLVFIILSLAVMSCSIKFLQINMIQKLFIFLIFLVMTFMWMISVLAELNRTPFDFAEGESELVSGFNTEFSSSPFALIFMAEYSMILFFSMLSALLMMGFDTKSLMFLISVTLMMFFFIWSRATLPRYRYDKLMNMCWKIILPSSTVNLFLVCFMMISQ